MRVCSCLASATELLYALGVGNSVVARTEHCDYPPAARRKPILVRSRIASDSLSSREIDDAVTAISRNGESHYRFDVALLKRLRPDVVVTQQLCNVCAASHDDVLEAARNLPARPRIVSLNGRRIPELLRDIRTLGRAVDQPDRAAKLAAGMRRDIDAIRRRLPRGARPGVWCAEWLDPLMAGGHWVPEVVALGGGRDLFGRPGEDSRRLAWDDVRRRDPEVIAVMPCSFSIARTVREFPLLSRLPGWRRLRAVRDGRVFAVAGSLFHHPGPRLINGIRLMAALCHPERFPAPPRTRARRLA